MPSLQDLVGGEGVTDVARRTTAVPGSAIPNFLPAGLWQAVLIARAARAQRRKHPSPGHDAAAHTEPLDALESHVPVCRSERTLSRTWCETNYAWSGAFTPQDPESIRPGSQLIM